VSSTRCSRSLTSTPEPRGYADFLKRWARRIVVALVVVIALVTIASFTYNAVTSDNTRSARELYAGPFVRVDGTEIAYKHWGSKGTPIVLIGGFVEAAWVWDRVAPLLAANHRVYALDLPPFGYSERRGPYTLGRWVDTVHGFVQRLGIKRPVLVGHSLGAAVAVGYARTYSGDQSGIVLLDGDALSESGAPRWLTRLFIDPFYTSLFRIISLSDRVARQALKEAYGPELPPIDGATLDGWQRPLRVAGTRQAFHELLGYGIQGYKLRDLPSTNARALVIWGADDTVDSLAAGRTSARALDAPVVVIPQAPHLSMLVAPGKIATVITRFAGTTDPIPTPIGRGALFHPSARTQTGGQDCTTAGKRYGAHLEVFARGFVVLVPAGIGVARPFTRRGAFVEPRGCTYSLRTLDPTGVIEVRNGTKATLGDFFALWGAPFSRSRLAGFKGQVRAYVGGRLWRDDPRAIPLTRHAQIVLEIGPYVKPHRRYLFRPGL
jgi:pimeloyl-ACP methyl ester carboxylesterase